MNLSFSSQISMHRDWLEAVTHSLRDCVLLCPTPQPLWDPRDLGAWC